MQVVASSPARSGRDSATYDRAPPSGSVSVGAAEGEGEAAAQLRVGPVGVGTGPTHEKLKVGGCVAVRRADGMVELSLRYCNKS